MRDSRLDADRERTWITRDKLERIEKARESARKLAEGPAESALLKEARASLDKNCSACLRAFQDEFVSAVRAIPERRATWSHTLRESFVVARESLASDLFGKSDRLQFEEASLSWQEQEDPFSVWRQHPSHITYRRGTIWHATQILIRVDPETGLRALDTLPYSKLMEEILHLYLFDDRDVIEELIKAAPPLFNDHGGWRPERSVAILLVTELVVKHAKELYGALARSAQSGGDEDKNTEAEAALKNLEEQDLQQWMNHAFNLLIQRPDGQRIALAYLSYLSREQLRESGSAQIEKDRWAAQSAAHRALVKTLNKVAIRAGYVRAAWEKTDRTALMKVHKDARQNQVRKRPSGKSSEYQGEGARTYHTEGLPLLFGAAAVLEEATPSEFELEAFWNLFEESLERRDNGFRLITHRTALTEVTKRFGLLLSRVPDPAVCLQAAYKQLEPQRRRALFAFRYDELPNDFESVVLLRVGLYAAVNWLHRMKDGEQVKPVRDLFFWIYEAARRLWLTTVLDTENTRSQLVTTSFAFMPFLFGEEVGAALKKAIPPLAGDAHMLTEACMNLWLNGIEATKLPPLMTAAGADLIAALHDVHQWSELTGRKEDFPEHLQKLADELGIDFAHPAVAPESERTRRLKEAFAEAIPWSETLLERLEADGCSGVRLTPLDQTGSTWVLQATLPEALRDRFGLSPDLRVLVVHGQVSGNALRRAMEEPEGIGEIDPDLLLIANQSPDLGTRLPRLAGPWGQRVPWPLKGNHFAPLADCLQEHLPGFDLFERRDPVRGRAFIGRRREVDAIAGRLLRGQTVGVFGLRKVGKSSLLQAVTEAVDPVGAALAALGSRARLASAAPVEALVVWLDVQSLVVRTRDAVAERLWEGLRDRLQAAGISTTFTPARDEATREASVVALTLSDAPSADPLDNLRRLLLAALGRRDVPPICFILDEYDLLFEGYGGEPAVAGIEQIFALLRGLGQTMGRVSLALIGRDPVFVDQPLLNGFTNPLLGWVEPFHLGPLSEDDATELLQRLGKRVGLDVGPATVQLAQRWTGGHPLLLREYGAALYEVGRSSGAARPLPSDPLCEDAAMIFLQRDAVHTICGEIEALLETRFPESLALLQQLASVPERDAPMLVKREASKITKALFDFGLLRGTLESPWLPLLYRDHFGMSVPESTTLPRSQSHVG